MHSTVWSSSLSINYIYTYNYILGSYKFYCKEDVRFLRYAFLEIYSCGYRREHRYLLLTEFRGENRNARVKFSVTFPVTPLSSPIKKISREAKHGENVIYTPRARIPRAHRQFLAFHNCLPYTPRRVALPERCTGWRIPGTIAEQNVRIREKKHES